MSSPITEPRQSSDRPSTFLSVVTCVGLGLSLSLAVPHGQAPPAFDLVIRGGTLVDGTGAPARRADIGVTGDRIARIAEDGIDPTQGRLVLDAGGDIVSPGFVDQHAHVQNIADYPLAETHVRQGITSIVSSPHSGEQVYPLDTYIATLKVVPNIGYYSGHSSIRRRVIGMAPREATASELAEMKRLVAQDMAHGALGLSTGLAIPPGSRAPLSEIIELAKVAAIDGGVYVSHIRDDATGVLAAVEEFLKVVDATGMPGQISHHTVSGAAQWGQTAETLAMVDAARARGRDVTLDIYPYTHVALASSSLMPDGARTEVDIEQLFRAKYVGDDLARLRFLTAPGAPQYVGKTMADLARDRAMPVSARSAARLVLDLEKNGGFTAAAETIREDDLRRLMRHPAVLFDTEDRLVGFGEGNPQPRTYGSFPRILGRYVREQHVLTLEEAIRKMTSMSADQIGQKDRGRIRAGAFADITVFNANIIADRATFENPHQFSVGIRHVIVNGVPVIRNGALTGEKPGRALKGPARPH
ncbi:MAG: D-aminoacylase [Vicinamibacterales bacterium]